MLDQILEGDWLIDVPTTAVATVAESSWTTADTREDVYKRQGHPALDASGMSPNSVAM